MNDIKTKIQKPAKKVVVARKEERSPRDFWQENKEAVTYKIRNFVLAQVLAELGELEGKISIKDITLDRPVAEKFGDYTTNIALILAGRLKMKPREVAERIAGKINVSLGRRDDNNDNSQISRVGEIGAIVDKVEVAGPGFINVWLQSSFLSTQLQRVLMNKNGVVTTYLAGKKIAVEYTDPNPFKEFHLGHLYSNVIGESISRLFEANGAVVWRGDFYGDVGMHVSKSVWGVMEKMNKEDKSLEDIEKLSLEERQKFLGEGYALGVRQFEENKEVAEEIKDINYLIYIAGQDLLQKTKGWKPIIDYRQYVKGREEKLPEVAKVYEAGLKWSLDYFESIYKILGTKFDGYYPESWVGEYGMKIVEKGLEKGILDKDYRTIIFKGEKFGLHTRVFVNQLGLPTYETKDLGLAYAKYKDFQYDLSLNIFGKEIDEYYKVVQKALELIEPDLGKKAFHIAHGMVKLPEGKMSSRTGNVITFKWLLEEVKNETRKLMKDSDLALEEKDRVASVVGLGAVRYALLKTNIGEDVVFDFGKSISFEGDSGPYLQYTYARAKSVLRKSKIIRQLADQKSKLEEERYHNILKDYQSISDEEKAVLRSIPRFAEVVEEAGRNFAPNIVANYLFDLAQKYNLFYNKHSILKPIVKLLNGQIVNKNKAIEQYSNESIKQSVILFRLALTEGTANIIKQGLYLLGIETVERM